MSSARRGKHNHALDPDADPNPHPDTVWQRQTVARLEVGHLPLEVPSAQLGGLQLVLAGAQVRLQRRPRVFVLLQCRVACSYGHRILCY
jgi:hypothetical protein